MQVTLWKLRNRSGIVQDMITKLKKKFIALAMASLIVLLAVIVAGMNIINYNSVCADADETLQALADNKGRLPLIFGDGLDDRMNNMDQNGPGSGYDDIDANTDDRSEFDGGEGRGGNAPSWMSRDEAEEARFFSVLADSDGNIEKVNTARIYSVDSQQAEDYATEILSDGKTSGFVDEFRYLAKEEGSYTRIIFLDCRRTLEAFRRFLYASIAMSLVGLAIVFGVICFFAGKIVRPVAESYEKQKRFITDAGHEIKTPLTIIKANIDVMRMDIDDAAEEAVESGGEEVSGQVTALSDNLQESLDDISGQVDRLTTLTNDLVYLSRMEEGSTSLTMMEVPISEIIAEAADAFEPVAKDRKKNIETHITPLLTVQGSTKELEKLISILMENALKYSPEGDTIGVKLYKDGKNVVLEVRNKSLTTISDEDLSHVFERFYRTDKSRNSAAGGHGIGLSMASAIVNAHGGKISAHSGDGTEFIVTAAIPSN